SAGGHEEVEMQFKNRAQAARLLADGLAGYRGSNPLVLAIPRGAVPMAHIIAERLGGEFDVVLVRKLGAPGNREFAVGAVDETGWVYLAPWAGESGADAAYVEQEKQIELETMRRRRAQYSPLRPPRDPAQPAAEPVHGMVRRLLERAGLLEQMGGTGHDGKFLVAAAGPAIVTADQRVRLAVELQHHVVVAADDQQRRADQAPQRLGA